MSFTSACRLLALDLDGTLLRDDQSIDERDRRAVARIRASGVRVVLATGRFPRTVLPHAEALGLDEPMVCADGAVVIRAGEAGQAVLPLPASICQRLLAVADEHALRPLLLEPGAVYGRPDSSTQVTYLAGWSPEFVPIEDWQTLLARLGAQGEPPASVVFGFALGSEKDVRAAAASLEPLSSAASGSGAITVDWFPLGPEGPHALRVRDARADKGRALAELASEWGMRPEEVAAVGDWYNDIGMLRWAGRSYAMQGSPVAVLQAARFELGARAGQGGGVAEAVDRLLAGRPG